MVGIENPDEHYGPYGNEWAATFAVNRTKFALGTEMARPLLKTEEDFLVGHIGTEVKNSGAMTTTAKARTRPDCS